MKSAEQLGKDARSRNTNSDLNPFEGINQNKADNWFFGWIERDWELQSESGMTVSQWLRYCERILK